MTGFYKDYADSSDTHQNSAEASADAAEVSANEAAASAAAAQDLEVTSASFDTADGTLTLTKANSGTVTTDLDGRYAELTGGASFSGGNFSVDGHTPDTLFIERHTSRVGIRTNDPHSVLHVEGDVKVRSHSPAIKIEDTDAGATDYSINNVNGEFSIREQGLTQGTDVRIEIEDTGAVNINPHYDSGSFNVNGNSTFEGSLTVDTDTLYVDADNNKVGINNNNPSEALDVTGNSAVSGDATVGGDATVSGELTVTGNAEADLFKGDLEGAVHFKGAVASGATLAKGDVVYVSGHSGQKTEVDLADASDSDKMPAFGIVAADPVGVNVDVVTFGTLKSIDTSTYTDGDELYVSTTAGVLTATAPSGEGNLVQKIAKVVKAHNSGNIKVMGAGRTNATPNLNDGNIFIGDSNNVATTASFATEVNNATAGKADLSGATFTGNVRLSDDVELRLGDGVSGDLRIFHSSANGTSTIREQGTGGLFIQGENLSVSDTSSNNYLSAIAGGATKIYYDGSSKIETRTDGIRVSGDIIVTGTVDGVDIATLGANAIVDGDFTSAGIMTTDGSGGYSIDSSTYLTASDITGKADLSGASFTGNVTIGIPPSGTQSLTVAGATDLYGGLDLNLTSITSVDALTAKNVDISTTGSVTTNIATGTVQNVGDTKTLNLGTGFSNQGTTTVNVGTSSGNINLNGEINENSDTTFGGSIVFTDSTHLMTVDGRDVSVDGAKLDTLERFYRTRFRERNSTTFPFQYLTNIIADIGTPVYTKSTTGSENTLDFYLGTTCADYYDNNDGHIEVVVTAPLPTSEDTVYLGTASNLVSDTSSGTYSFDVIGDFTHHLTDYCGLSVNSDGSNAFLYGQVRSNAYYNPHTNKTTISCNLYQSYKPALYQTVYLHPFDWENSGTDIIGSTIQIDEVVYNSQKMSRRDFSVYLGYFKSKVPIQLRGKETSSTTDNIAIRNFGGVITQIED